MKNRIAIALAMAMAMSLPACGQMTQWPMPPALEKELAARAADVTEVTLDKNMLGFASRFMNHKDKDDPTAKRLIEGLDGIYVREYTFDKEGQVSAEEIEQLRKHFETAEWTPLVRERERKRGETTDILVKMVNGESHGMFIFEAEPKELTIVLILGPVKMEDLGKLKSLGGLGGALGSLGPLAGAQHAPHGNGEKDKKGGAQ